MNYIGTKINKPIADYDYYAKIATWCNKHNAKIEDKGDYYEVVEVIIPEPTLEEQVIALEHQYNMCRWQREGILAPNSEYSDYTKNKAQEIEDLAEELRRLENN